MGTPSGSSKQPPIAPRAHLQSLISSPQAAPPTGPRNLGYSTNESFSVNNQDFSASRNSQTSTITPLPTLFTTLPPRVRPRHWRTLCRNTVPYDQPYPPPSSQTTIPNLCGRGDSCHYGHHGDVYLDAVELGTLSFEHGIPHALGVDINSYDMGSSWSDHHVSLSVETNERRDSNVRQGLGCEPGANESFHSGQGVEAWMEKRAEWRRRQAVLGPHADSTYTQPKWEDRYKNKDAKNRRNDTGRHPIENKRSPVGGIDENGWGEYTARRQRAQVNTKERQWQWELETATTTNRQETQDSTQFEQSLKQLSLNYPGGLPPGAACRRGANNPQGIEEAEEDQGESTSSGETASTVQFIIPPFQKGLKPFQNTPAHSPMKPNVVAVPYSLSHTVSLANFSFDPSAVAFSPTPSSNMQGLRTFRGEGPPAPVLTRQPSRELIFSPKALPPPQPAPGHSQSFSVPHNGMQWDLVRNTPQQYSTSNQRTHQQQTAVWVTMEEYKYYIEQERRLPPNLDWRIYEKNISNADYGQRLARCDSRPLQKPHRTGNTFIVQSHPSTAHSRIQTTPPLRPQLHLNHTLNQMTMLLSLYPDCSNKVQTTEVLTKLIVPDTPEDMNRSPSYISESLQTALHRLALSISQQENEIVAQFQAEMWGVLAWLGANGGSVALLTESEDKGRMVDKQSVERVLDVCGNVEADANARGAGIMLASGQITLHGTDEHDEGYSEVVALTPGQPAILSPVLPSASQAPASDWHLPTMIVNGSPILSAKSNGNKEGSEYHGQVRQPLPPTSAEEILVPLSSSSANHPLPTQANEQYTLETISFFLSNKMESYLQDSYDKVVRVQTAISLKWRRVSKVFEREWCSGISRYARNGIVLRAFWNVHAMEETDWLAMEDSFAHSGIPHTWEQVWGQSTNRSASTGSGSTEKPISVEGNRGAEHKPVSKNSWDSYSPTLSQEFRYWDKQPTGATRAGQEIPHEDSNAKRNGKEGHQDTWETRCRMPQRAVWDRRGLCQEVEPVALSNEGRHFLELIEKMCLKQVMDFADIDIGGKSSEYILKLPPPPAVRLFRKSEFKDDGDNIHPATVGNEDWSVPLGSKNGNYSRQFEGSSSDDWSHYKPVESGQASRSQGKEDYNDNSQSRGRRRERGGPNTSTRSSTVPGLCLEDEYNIEFDSSEEFLLPLLIHSLKLEPRLIESPVLNPIFRRSGPLYYTGNTSIGEEVFGAEESKIDAKVRAKHLEMCHLDRSLFMGYIVLEILNVWEEQRKHAARVRWKFPELDRKALVGERVKILAEKNLRLAKERKERQERVVQETAPAPAAPPPPPAPNWADVARGKGKVEEKKAPPATQTPVLKTPVKEKQAEAQLLTGKLNVKEKQPPTVGAQVSVVKTLMAAPPNQPDSTPKTLKQAESTTSQKYVPGPQPVEIPKARLPGSGLLYTDILKKSAALNQGQPILHPSPAPPLPAHVAVKATADTEEATDTGADDAAVWKMYKSKKEKKADLHESNDYHKRDTVKTRTLAPTLAPTMPSKGKQKSGTTPKNTSSTTPCPPPKAPPLQLKLDTTVRKQVAKEEATEDWPPPLASPPQILIALPEQPKAPTLRDLEISVDQEIEGEKQRLRRWLYRLQTWLWTFNEGVGLNFVEITDTPDWDTGFSDSVSSTHGGDEGQTEYARSGPCVAGCGSLGGSQNGMGQPRRVHRGGSRNKHTLWKMEVREREMMERETNEKELKEMEVRERAREMGVWCTGGGRSQPGLGPWMSGALIDDGERRGRSLEIAMPSW